MNTLIPANSITWPPRCENVLRAAYGDYYASGRLTLATVERDSRERPERFLRYRNFGRTSLQRMGEIIEEAWHEQADAAEQKRYDMQGAGVPERLT